MFADTGEASLSSAICFHQHSVNAAPPSLLIQHYVSSPNYTIHESLPQTDNVINASKHAQYCAGTNVM
jgi:hypothetical protein